MKKPSSLLKLRAAAVGVISSAYGYARPATAAPAYQPLYPRLFTLACLAAPFAVAFTVSFLFVFPVLSALGLGPQESSPQPKDERARQSSEKRASLGARVPASSTGISLGLSSSSSLSSTIGVVIEDEDIGHSLTTSSAAPRNGILSKYKKLRKLVDSYVPLPKYDATSGTIAVIFSTSVGLSGLLVGLILCELMGLLDPGVRAVSFEVLLWTMLLLAFVVIPVVEIRSAYTTIYPWIYSFFRRPGTPTRPRVRSRSFLVFMAVGLLGWMLAFWYIGGCFVSFYVSLNDVNAVPVSNSYSSLRPSALSKNTGFALFREGLFERICVLGITLMSSLAGFAGSSNVWHNFGPKQEPVTEADIAKQESLLRAIDDMAASKQSRLDLLSSPKAGGREQAAAAAPPPGPLGLLASLFAAASPESHETALLRAELDHLEEARLSASDQLYASRARRSSQRRDRTVPGKILRAVSILFSAYCCFRIVTGTLGLVGRCVLPTVRHRQQQPAESGAEPGSGGSLMGAVLVEPAARLLALLTEPWEPALDAAMWRQNLAFLPSGFMLLASLNSILQTAVLFTRLAPSVMRLVRSNGCVLISQLAATYVVAAAVLLRARLPPALFGARVGAFLWTGLEPAPASAWFENCFLLACAGTAVAIWLGRQLAGESEPAGAGEAEGGQDPLAGLLVAGGRDWVGPGPGQRGWRAGRGAGCLAGWEADVEFGKLA